MIVEDNMMDVIVLKEVFNHFDQKCRFSFCMSGEAALNNLERMKHNPVASMPDLIITDLYLPKMSGHDLLANLQEDPQLKGIPVMMVSNTEDEEDIKAAYDMNVVSFIKKEKLADHHNIQENPLWNFQKYADILKN
jgi:CheY-like chemotaxis protein